MEDVYDSSVTMDDVVLKTVQDYVMLFQGFKIINFKGQTLAMIVHNQFVSVFDIIAWKWVTHLEFTNDIRYIFL